MKQSEALYSLVKQSDEGEKFGREYGWDLRSQVCDWRGVSCDDGVSVTKLDISGAGYSGSIPREFESLVTLKNLTLSHNKFIGLVPPQVAQLPALEVFDVLNNTLMGPLPIFDKNKSPKLQRVILQSNMFTHRLTPEWLKALPATTLTELNLSDNEITGSLPTEIGTLQELDTLDVSINAFYGTIPAQLANMPKLRFLYLNVNRFVGTIPRSISTSDRIFEEVWFQNNLLSGTIPADFAEMPNLLDFYVDGNYFSGTIPTDLCRPNINADFYADQYNTEVYGNPTDQGQERNYCESISCPVNKYSIEGIWPCADCPATERTPYLGTEIKCFPTNQEEILNKFWMDTQGSQWSASSTWKYDGLGVCDYSGVSCDAKGDVTKIVLPYMNLRGTISPELGFLEHLDTLILSDNKISGYIPTTLQMAPLELLDITGNHIQGIVPPKMCLMSVNRNGEGNEYECDKVACPVGTYYPTGVGPGCAPCQDETTYLGQKQCENPGHVGGHGFFTSMEEDVINSGSQNVVGGILLLLFISSVLYCIGLAVWSRYKKKQGLIAAVMDGRSKHTARSRQHERLATTADDDGYENVSYPSTELASSTPNFDDRFEINSPELCDVPVLETPKVDTPDFPEIPEMT